jgi:hypothetical protein
MELTELEKFFLLEYILFNNYGWKTIESYDGVNPCGICFKPMNQDALKLPCHDVYHHMCMYTNIMIDGIKQCPMCNTEFEPI